MLAQTAEAFEMDAKDTSQSVATSREIALVHINVVLAFTASVAAVTMLGNMATVASCFVQVAALATPTNAMHSQTAFM